jgi:hypothetical protein
MPIPRYHVLGLPFPELGYNLEFWSGSWRRLWYTRVLFW